ncbi:hypothetical protein OTU49_011556 [Cherax quadricarinatus]|uniref:FAS1 domain-containing protein n=1 Tax=Cherax quadricarinatus TaxID=27406 RepID=A0AAW0W3Q9_CHEQU
MVSSLSFRLGSVFLLLVLVTTCRCATFTPAAVEGRLVVPDTARVDNTLLKTVQADKFLSLWFIYILSDAVHTSSEPWTLLVPLNSGLPKDGGFLVDRESTVRVLLNHAVLGSVVDPQHPPNSPLTSLAGSPLTFTADHRGAKVNGVRLTGNEYRFSDGVIYIIEKALPVVVEGESLPSSEVTSNLPEVTSRLPEVTSRLPPLTHRFATFKPRRGSRPSGINTFRRTKPEVPVEVPVEVTSEVEPVLADELLTSDFEGTPKGLEAGYDEEFSGDIVDDTSSASSAPNFEFSEFEVSTVQPPSEEEPFLASFLQSLEANAAYTGSEFLHHFKDANITSRFRDTGRYTALVPYDSAFYGYYPIDWGFNPFLVENFTRELMVNHFVRGNIALEDLPSLAELPTLGGRVIKFTKKAGKLLANGVEVVLESETRLSRGRSYSTNDLLFVDYDQVLELQAQHGDLETAPLLGDPWPTSQFLSHLLSYLQKEPQTSFFAEYLNLTNLAYLLPGHDENLDPLKYTAFIPMDNVIAETLYADAPDPFLLDEILRENMVLNHLVRGRFYEKDLKDGLTLKTLANNTLTISKGPDNSILVNNAKVVGSQAFIYNLGIVYLIDNVLVITDQDIVKAINKFPDLHLGGPTEESDIVGSSNPLEDDESAIPSRPAAPQTTTSRPATTQAPTTSLTPAVTHTLPSLRTSTSSVTPTATTRFFNIPKRPTFTASPPTTSSRPKPTPTTPRIRFETRTEISITRQVNDGEVEPIGNPSS